jgi:glycosyltransferase involved in cell wall biosynthesis
LAYRRAIRTNERGRPAKEAHTPMVDIAHRGSGGPLRIAMVAPPWYALPPSGYGGIEISCATLIDALVRDGHDVTLFGAGARTGTLARFVSTMPDEQYPRIGDETVAALHTARVNILLNSGRFDVIHDHTVSGPLTALGRAAPTVVTAHGPAEGDLGGLYGAVSHSVSLVAISDAQRRARPDFSWAATIHHGIDPTDTLPRSRRDGPVLWLARFSPDKGPDLAIEACRAAGLPLVLAGKCTEPGEARYLDERIRPMLGPGTKLVCNADRATTWRLLASARCLILPLRWEEPFGMVMIEAMAVGIPVVALRRGSVPEVITEGETGWICDRPEDLPLALTRVGELDSAACLHRARTAFSPEVMARRYVEVYRRAIARRGGIGPLAAAATLA